VNYSNKEQDNASENGASWIGDAVDMMKHHVGEATSQMREHLPSTDQMRSAVVDNSLAMVGGAFALGLLTGLVVPVSPGERSRIGPLRDSLVDRAGDVAADVMEHGKQVIAETATAAANSAREHGREVLADVQRVHESPASSR
jgi:hypothetical protein